MILRQLSPLRHIIALFHVKILIEMSLQFTAGPEAWSQDNSKWLLGYEDAAFMQWL